MAPVATDPGAILPAVTAPVFSAVWPTLSSLGRLGDRLDVAVEREHADREAGDGDDQGACQDDREAGEEPTPDESGGSAEIHGRAARQLMAAPFAAG